MRKKKKRKYKDKNYQCHSWLNLMTALSGFLDFSISPRHFAKRVVRRIYWNRHLYELPRQSQNLPTTSLERVILLSSTVSSFTFPLPEFGLARIRFDLTIYSRPQFLPLTREGKPEKQKSDRAVTAATVIRG